MVWLCKQESSDFFFSFEGDFFFTFDICQVISFGLFRCLLQGRCISLKLSSSKLVKSQDTGHIHTNTEAGGFCWFSAAEKQQLAESSKNHFLKTTSRPWKSSLRNLNDKNAALNSTSPKQFASPVC